MVLVHTPWGRKHVRSCEALAHAEPSKIDLGDSRVRQKLRLCVTKRRLSEVRNQQRQVDLSFQSLRYGASNAIIPVNLDRVSTDYIIALPHQYLPPDMTVLNSQRSSSATFRGI